MNMYGTSQENLENIAKNISASHNTRQSARNAYIC